MHPYGLDQHPSEEFGTARQTGLQAPGTEERRRSSHCSDFMNEATLIESPTITPDSSPYIRLMDSPSTYYHPYHQPTLGVSDTFVQPQQLCSATAEIAEPRLNCSSMLITDEPTGGVPGDGSYSRGDGTSSNNRGIRQVEHLANLDLMSYSQQHGEDEFDFLKSIIRDTQDPPAPGDILDKSTMITAPTPVPTFYKLVEEQKLRSADEIAACIWLAGEKEGLFARATYMWAMIEAELPVIHVTGRSLSEAIVDRLEATRQSIDAQLRMADDFDRVRGRMPIVEPDWRTGNSILKGEVITRLEMLRIGNFMGGSHLSVTQCHQEVVERLRHTRDAVMGRITENHKAAMTAAGVHGTQFSPVISDDEVLMGIESMVQSSLLQLKARCISLEDELRSTGTGRHYLPVPQCDTPWNAHDDSKSDTSTSDNPSVIRSKVHRTRPGVKSVKRKRKPGSGGRRCKHEDCSLHPHFGFTRPEYCSSHKLPGMFNVKGRRCNHPECSRTPVYGNRGDPHPTYCAAHKLLGMVDIKNPTCRESSCSRQPSFGWPQDRKATYCATHMEEGMVNVRRMLASRVPSRNS